MDIIARIFSRALYRPMRQALLPKLFEWSGFAATAVVCAEVAQRYWFGQLRHSRLNWLVRLLQPQYRTHFFYYHLRWWSIGLYLTILIVPLAFLFASIGIVLSAMQVVIAAIPNLGVSDNRRGFVSNYVW
jgi:hypothetical protein